MKYSQIKFLSLLMVVFGLLFTMSSCTKENIEETSVVVEEVIPEVVEETILSFKLYQDGLEIINVSSNVSSNAECMFGNVIELGGSTVSYMYTIGTSNDFQLLWQQDGTLEPHTFVAEPDIAGAISFILLDPCTGDAGEIISLQNHTITLDEVGDVGEIMSGTFEGEMQIGLSSFSTITGSFSVPRI